MTKLTFVVTSYNYEKFIEETLNSIKNQTFKDFELIVVDDFSKDNSVEIIKKFIDQNPEIKTKLIVHDKNYGQLKSIISGLKESKGEFISFIDSDDILLETYAENLLKAHSKTNVGFISCDFQEIDKSSNIIKNKSSNKELKVLTPFKAPFGGWFWNPMPTAMFKTLTLKNVKNYDTPDDWRICPDKFLFNLVNLTDNSAILNEILVKKRCHGSNAGKFNRTKLNIKNNLKIRRTTLKFIKKYYKNNSTKYAIIIYLSYFYVPFQILKYVKKIITSKFSSD